MKKVSVVVPVYNMERYLTRCMETLLNQTTDEMEIILIDDGSKDKSGVMCDEYAEKYPALIRVVHKTNGGLSSARNTGIDVAKGQYIIFPDPDDWVETNYISRFIELYDKYNPDLVCLGHYIDYENGESVAANENVGFIEMNGAEAQKALLSYPNIRGFAWNKLYKLKIINEYNLKFLDDVGTTEDMDFAFRYLKYCKKVCFDPQSRVYHYFQRENSATLGGFSLDKFYSIRTYEKIIEGSQKNSEVFIIAGEQIYNIALNLIYLYKKDGIINKPVWKSLCKYLRKNLWAFLAGKHYGINRKLQGVIAFFMPYIYAKCRNYLKKG
ncbi:MAG: glycosyltransferase [Ruminococcus sp.]|nr:glycosyltransferase [Ruminococcus sp.]